MWVLFHPLERRAFLLLFHVGPQSRVRMERHPKYVVDRCICTVVDLFGVLPA